MGQVIGGGGRYLLGLGVKVIKGRAFRWCFRVSCSSAELIGLFGRHRPQTCLREIVYPCFHTSLALQSAGAKVASHVNLISYTLKVDILCKLAAAWLRQSLRV